MDTPQNLMMINGVLAFEEPLELDAVRRLVSERLVRISRFRQCLVDRPGAPAEWIDAEPFELERHVEEVVLPAPGGDRELADLVGRLMSEELDPERPLWHFLLVQGYGGGSALVGRLHHCIGDGIALMLVFLSLTDTTAEGDPGGRANAFLPLFEPGDVDLDAVLAETERIMPDGMKLLTQPVDALKGVHPFLTGLGSLGALTKLMVRRKDPATVFKGPLGTTKRAGWSRAISLDEVHSTRRPLEASVNDVLLTATAGGLRRYAVDRGAASLVKDVHAAVPVNLRPLDRMADLGNEFGLVFLPLPVGIEDPLDRLAEIRVRMRRLKRSVEPVAVFKVLDALGRVPHRLQAGLTQLLSTKVTAVMTNVPGPASPLYFAGRRVSDLFFWVPQSGEVGLGVSILSYDSRVRVGFMTDSGLVPDPHRLAEAFEAEWDEVRRVAMLQ